MKLRLLPIIFLAQAMLLNANWQRSPFFNTQILKNPLKTENLLKKVGFTEGFFKTKDKTLINYLWLKRPNARFTLICAAGFWPGRKEGMATLHALLPDDCNILLFDARGHGKSSGELFSKIWHYAQSEYKDVVGAIDWASTQDNCPIILYGICAGAYHATKAALKKQESRVVGLIFDSGWANLETTAASALESEITNQSFKLFKKFTGKKNILFIKNGTKVFSRLTAQAVRFSLLKPFFTLQKPSNLILQVHMLDIPVFYIHSFDDDYVSIKDVQKMANNTKKPFCWWIQEKSKHACHHLKYKELYRKKLHHFVDECVAT